MQILASQETAIDASVVWFCVHSAKASASSHMTIRAVCRDFRIWGSFASKNEALQCIHSTSWSEEVALQMTSQRSQKCFESQKSQYQIHVQEINHTKFCSFNNRSFS